MPTCAAACAVAVSDAAQRATRVVVLAAPVSEANAARGVTEPLGHRVARTCWATSPFEPQLAAALRRRLAARVARARPRWS